MESWQEKCSTMRYPISLEAYMMTKMEQKHTSDTQILTAITSNSGTIWQDPVATEKVSILKSCNLS